MKKSEMSMEAIVSEATDGDAVRPAQPKNQRQAKNNKRKEKLGTDKQTATPPPLPSYPVAVASRDTAAETSAVSADVAKATEKSEMLKEAIVNEATDGDA